MATEYKLPYTAAQIEEKLDKIDAMEADIKELSGGNGDYVPVPETAEVGQTIVVKAVDENGKPTEWMPADIANEKWELIVDITIEEEVAQVNINKDINGEKFELRKSHVVVRTEATASNTSDKSAYMRVGKDGAAYELNMNIPRVFRADATNGFSATFDSTGFSHQGFAKSSSGLAYGYNRIISEDNISADPIFPLWCNFFRIYGGTFAIGSRIRIWGVRA